MGLPDDFIPATTWQIVTPETRQSHFYPDIRAAYLAAKKGPGWHPKAVQLGGKLKAIDYCGHDCWRRYDDSGDLIDRTHPHSFKVALVDDHPFLDRLPKNAPRSVRHMFTAETRMRWLRMTDTWDYMAAFDLAMKDWAEFCKNGGHHAS